ncbi:hypothetical protein M5689_007729 [Euphorbia peplus]|nr:hypothetical protein M5689_007729 [Euphorbia peplus]
MVRVVDLQNSLRKSELHVNQGRVEALLDSLLWEDRGLCPMELSSKATTEFLEGQIRLSEDLQELLVLDEGKRDLPR